MSIGSSRINGWGALKRVLILCAIGCSSGAFAADPKATSEIERLILNPPILRKLVYRSETAGRVHFGLVKLQENAFFAKTADTLDDLDSPHCGANCAVAGRFDQLYWSRLSQTGDQLNIADMRSSSSESVANSAIVTSNSVYAVAVEALNVVFLGTPCWKKGEHASGPDGITGIDRFGGSFVLQFNATNDMPEANVKITYPEGAIMERQIRYGPVAKSTAPWPGFMYLVNHHIQSGQTTESRIQILEVRTNKSEMPAREFLWNDQVLAGLLWKNTITNNTRIQEKVDPLRDRKIVIGSVVVSQSEVAAIYVCLVCAFAVSLWMLYRFRARTARKNKSQQYEKI